MTTRASRRHIFTFLGGLVLVIATSALLVPHFFGTPLARTTAPPEKLSLRLQWLHQAQFAGFYVAKEKGFYREEGLDVTINSGGQDFNAVTLVASGSDDVGIWTADQVLLAYSRGVPIRAVGVVFDRSLAAFMVRSSSGIKTPKDFEGKTVGMYYGYDTETLYLHLLKKFGVDRSKIQETALQYDLGRFYSGEVDVWPAYAINQPLAAKQAGIGVNLLTPEQFGIRYYSDTIIVSDSTLRKRRDSVVKFLRASQQGWEYALAHRDEAVDIVLTFEPHLDKEHQKQMLDVVAEYVNKKEPMFSMDRDTWDSIAVTLVDQGLLKESPDIARLVDFNIVE